ncbi:uncharacterized protein LOC135924710 [Gordionus sp. m RMFG-2023]|uniref:uncharacterized protein LOC135924710 n=1 Tax=Gordionus sp. m RMFG-2023 TaxID=3053472 RepID=UPI0031FC45EE
MEDIDAFTKNMEYLNKNKCSKDFSLTKVFENVLNGTIISNVKKYNVIPSTSMNNLFDNPQNQTIIDIEPGIQKNKHIFSFLTISIKERLIISMCLLCFSILLFFLSCMYIPLLILKARKFALLYSLSSFSGCLSIIILTNGLKSKSNCININPLTLVHMKFYLNKGYKLLSQSDDNQQTLPINSTPTENLNNSKSFNVIFIIYIITSLCTIYSAVWLKSTLLTIIFCIIQFISLILYVINIIPGGNHGLYMLRKMFTYTFKKTFNKIIS